MAKASGDAVPAVRRAPSDPQDFLLLMEQYNEYVRQANATTEQRLAANRFFISLNSAIAASYGFLAQANALQSTLLLPFLLIVAALLGLLACRQWRRRVSSYKDLLTAKFDVIHELETYLPAQPYTAEYPRYAKLKPFSTSEGTLIAWIRALHLSVLGLLLIAGSTECGPNVLPAGLCGGLLDVGRGLSAVLAR